MAKPLAPPRPELVALLDAVKDNPDEDTPRLVLADWLDEQDNALDAERARFIREDIGRASARRTQSRSFEATDASEILIPRWLGPVAGLGGARLVRGLPQLAIRGQRFFRPDVATLVASEPFAFVQFVYFEGIGSGRLESLAESVTLQFIPGLHLHPSTTLTPASSASFFGSPHLSGLRQMECRSVYPDATGILALANNPALARLRKLALACNRLNDEDVVALAASRHFANLQTLDLSFNNIGEPGAEALAASPLRAHLLELNLRDNRQLTDHGRQLLRGAFGGRVKL